VQFVYGFSRRDGEWEAILRFKALRHPSLRPVEVVQYEPGRLVLLTELVEKNLHDRLQECQAEGLPGIPRGELLGYLRVAAETLQQLYREHAALHLGLNPRVLLLNDGRLAIADMGLTHLLWDPAGQKVASLNARYAAPELFQERSHPASDQYSLAVLFQELLTGIHPFSEADTPSPARRRPVKPNLDPLPHADRVVIARALDPDPRRRWSGCPELVLALTAGVGKAGRPSRSPLVRQPTIAHPTHPAANGAMSERDEALRRRYKSRLPLELIRPRLGAFRVQWQGQVVGDEATKLVFRVNLPRSFWQRWLGRQSGLEVQVELARAKAGAPTEVTVQIQSFGCGRETGGQLVKDMGALLLESLRSYLQVNPERRLQERLIWPHPVLVRPVVDGTPGEAVEGQGKDISPSGIGFYSPEQLATSRLQVELTAHGEEALSVPATVVRVQRCGENWFEMGALFVANAAQQKAILDLCAR